MTFGKIWKRATLCAISGFALISGIGNGFAGSMQKDGQFKFGVLKHDVGLFSSDRQEGIDLNLEYQFPTPDVLRFIGSPRPHVGTVLATHSDSIHQFYTGLSWNYNFLGNVFVSGHLGGVVHTADTLKDPGPTVVRDPSDRYLGCRVLYRLAAGLGYQVTDDFNVELYADHISNANLCDNNQGLENAGIRFGYSF